MSGVIPATTPSRLARSRDYREDVELAVMAKLASVRAGDGGLVARIRAYTGNFESLRDDASIDDVKRAIGATPAILVGAGHARYESANVSQDSWRSMLTVDLWICNSNLRDQAERERDENGIFRLMGHCRALLAGVKVDVDGAQRLRLVEEDSKLTHEQLSIWLQTYSLQVEGRRPYEGIALTAINSRGFVPEIVGSGKTLSFAGGTVTLDTAVPGFHRGLLGLEMHIEGATTPGNNGGPFPITDVPDVGDGTQISFLNPLGAAEPFTGTWTIKRTAPLISAVQTL